MANRRRNFAILAAVFGLLILSALIIVPGSPQEKKTRLGLDLAVRALRVVGAPGG